MTREQIALEIGKLLIQGAFALFVAHRAVQWALARYKKEKLWERRLAAYSDVVSALGEMRLVSGSLFDHYARISSITDEGQQALYDRHRAARRKFDEAAATAALILDARTSDRLQRLVHDLERNSEIDMAQREDYEYGLYDAALKDIPELGKKSLA